MADKRSKQHKPYQADRPSDRQTGASWRRPNGASHALHPSLPRSLTPSLTTGGSRTFLSLLFLLLAVLLALVAVTPSPQRLLHSVLLEATGAGRSACARAARLLLRLRLSLLLLLLAGAIQVYPLPCSSCRVCTTQQLQGSYTADTQQIHSTDRETKRHRKI